VSFLNRGLSAIGKLVALAVLATVFIAGMAVVVLMSLQGSEIKVPEITGKNFTESEHELASLGLKIKKRADRVSQDPPNTIIEQLPKAGETVKTGQMILVVTSKAPGEGDETPAVLKKNTDADDAEKIEEMISDKPKKPKANSNANANKKKADTTRDVMGDNSNSNTNSNSADSNSNKKDPGTGNNSTTNSNKNNQTPGSKPPSANSARPNDGRPRLSNRP
jgi:beta-lactam-binding protein with PASTA domain